MYVATFRLHTACLHQAMRSTGYAKPNKPLCSAVIGWFSTAGTGEVTLVSFDTLIQADLGYGFMVL